MAFEQLLEAEILVIELLLLVSLVALAVRRVRVPYTVALVLVGLAITAQPPFRVEITPELILALFVPPLVFEAAFHLSFIELRRVFWPVIVFAAPGVVITTVIVAGVVGLMTPIPWTLALVFGALIAASDPVAVVALFRTLGAPRRLATLLEGESLLNDGTAIVLFQLMVVMALTGTFDLAHGVADFVRVAVGGAIIGLGLGWVSALIIARVDDYLIETTITTVLAFGSYLVAEKLHLSGVLAVVVAGLITGNVGPRGMSPTTRIVLTNFWEYIAFLANSLLFLLIGLQVQVGSLIDHWLAVLAAIVGVLAARLVVIYGLGWLTDRWTEPIPPTWKHILNWGGLRGAVSLALALSLPAALGPERDTLRTMTFGVVLFTLLVQGLTMGPLLRRLRIVGQPDHQLEFERRHARMRLLQAAETHLDHLNRHGLITAHAGDTLQAELRAEIEAAGQAVRDIVRQTPALEAEALATARREVIRAQRGALFDLRRDGVISEHTFDELSRELDAVIETFDSDTLEER